MSVTAEPETPRALPMWKRLLLGTAALLGVVAALVVVGSLASSRDSEVRLKELTDKLDKDDPLWRLSDIQSDRAEVADLDNSARWVAVSQRALPTTWPSEAVGKLFDEAAPPPARMGQLHVETLAGGLAAAAPALADARRLADLPRGRYKLAFPENPFHLLLEEQQRSRSVATLLALDAVHLAHQGDMAGAAASCRAALSVARSLGDEPLVISTLIRMSNFKTFAEATERVLALGVVPEPELAKLAGLLAEEGKYDPLLPAFRCERAALHQVMLGLGDGRFSFADPSFDRHEILEYRERFAGWHLRSQVRREHPELLGLLNRAVEAARLPPHEQAKPLAAIEWVWWDHKHKGTSLTVPLLMLNVAKTGERARQGQALARTLRVAVAAERYRLARGEWPASLADLAPAYLDAVPLDPMDGAPLRYLRRGDGVTVYSVGLDGVDDGGRIDRQARLGRGCDVGYRLWDVGLRGAAK